MTSGGQPPGIPEDEGVRLLALSRLALLDTAPEEAFDRVTRLAAHALDVPIALVSLVDQTRQWFKSCVGLSATQTSREISFCGHAVFERAPLVVPDATLDPRFADNPLVTAAPRIRAYLGIPIYTSDDQPIGTLCVIDTRPRLFDAHSVALLSDLAAIVQESVRAREYIRQSDSILQFAQAQERLFRDTFEGAAVGMVHVSLGGLLLRSNQSACRLLGYSHEDLKMKSVIDLTHPEDLLTATDPFRRAIMGEMDSYQVDKRLLRGDHSYFWARVHVVLLRNSQGLPDYFIANLEDISERRSSEQEMSGAWERMTRQLEEKTGRLREQADSARRNVQHLIEAEARQRSSDRRFRAITDGLPAMIGYWNRALRCEYANAAYLTWFGIAPEAVIGMHMSELFDKRLWSINEPHAHAALAGEAQQFERPFTKPDGTAAFVEARYLPDRDDTGVVKGIFTMVTDITALVNARLALESSNANLVRESGTDFLTGLANRRVFDEHCEDAATAFVENHEHYGLILLDLDNFKGINDRFGHEVGDRVLRAVGRVLREDLRGRQDLAARLGGEELALLCIGDLGEIGLRQIAERIRTQLNRESVNTVKGRVTFTASFGVAHSQPGDANWKSVFERADAALYRAKEAGKDRVMFGRTVLAGGTGRFTAMKLVSRDAKN